MALTQEKFKLEKASEEQNANSCLAPACGAKCRVCAKLPFHRREMACTMAAGGHIGSFWNFGIGEGYFCEPPHGHLGFMNEENGGGAGHEKSKSNKIIKHVKALQKELADVGLLSTEDQRFSGESTNARVMAPFTKDEIVKGRLLGMGGFSCVYEIEKIRLDSFISAGVTGCEQGSRKFMADHAQRQLTERENTEATRTVTTRPRTNSEDDSIFCARYAIKQLRHTLSLDQARLEASAVDLVLEGQMLLALDHPNIITIRGWSYPGPSSYRSDRFRDYFLVIDQLPESLESRVAHWRQRLRKYKCRATSLPWGRKKYTEKINKLLVERLKVAYDTAGALEYLHDRRIMNRDVKLNNIGFDVHGDLKIFDFGLARLLPSDGDGSLQDGYSMSRVGTKYYMAPEVRKKEKYSLPADVYSYGVVLWELLSLSNPRDTYHKMKEKHPSNESLLDEIWLPVCPCWPKEIQNMVRRCLSITAAVRPTMSEIRTVLMEQIVALQGGDLKQILEKRRRRSTFRVNLAPNNHELNEVRESLQSKTSRSSFDGSSLSLKL